MRDRQPEAGLLLKPWGHRPALDGLRTISVYLVVAFHADVLAFAGGFIGVDLFFVLSGYLVTMVLWTDYQAHNRLRLGRFYARRVRRLVPAALVAIVGAAILMLLVSGFIARDALIDDARAAALWFSNWHFIAESADYFGATTAKSPYQHFWSLSIEEQFYVGFPLCIWGLAWLARRAKRDSIVPFALTALGVVSLILQFARSGDVSRAYYGTDTRAYQLLFGAALALVFDKLRTERRSLPVAFRTAGSAIVATAMSVFVVASTDLVDMSVSVRGVVACVCALAMLAGLEFDVDGPIAKALSVRPMTYLGSISYGTYLWHWPIIVAYRVLYPETNPWIMLAIAAIGATVLAAVSSLVVELPIRNGWQQLPKVPVIAAALGLSVAVAIVVPLALGSTSRPPLRTADVAAPIPTASATPAPGALPTPGGVSEVSTPNPDTANPETPTAVPTTSTPDVPLQSPDAQFLKDVAEDLSPNVDPCAINRAQECILHQGDSGLHILLIGDSEAQVFANPFLAKAREFGHTLSMQAFPGCPWMQNVFTDKAQWQRGCQRTHNALYGGLLERLDPDIVVAFNLGRLDPEVAPIEQFIASDERYAGLSTTDLVEASVRDSAEFILQVADRLIIMEPAPLPPTDPIECMTVFDDARQCGFTHHTPLLDSEVIYRSIAAGDDRIATLDVDLVSCPDYPECPALIDETPVYRDPWHVWQGFYLENVDELWSIIEPALQ